MRSDWLILADDLTGAADTAVAFARRRGAARVVWGDTRLEDHPDVEVLAYDAATRELDGALAASRHAEALHRLRRPQANLFKKIDSTLRGHPAEEIAAMLGVVFAESPATRVILAPSFPAMGRTLLAGQVRVHGVPLPLTEYWPEGREPGLADLATLLARAGVAAHHLPLAAVRASAVSLRAALAPPDSSTQARVAVCDAETDEDLDRIAAATLHPDAVLFIGSAGLAHALARRVAQPGASTMLSHRVAPSSHGALIVVGSRAQASRAALARVKTFAEVRSFRIEPELLAGDLQTKLHAAFARDVEQALTGGQDVVVDIPSNELPQDLRLVAALARLVAPAARSASALVATGGETATALFTRLGITGLELLAEIEPGICLGITLGGLSIPAVTKAGGFGHEDCLMCIISRLRSIRQTGAVA